MKDKEGTELVQCDVVLLTIDTPVYNPTQVVVFIRMEEEVINITLDDEEVTKTINTLVYYPITDEALQVSNFDKNITQTALHRQKTYKTSNVESKHLLKVNPNTFRGHQKTLYDNIYANCLLVIDNTIATSVIVAPSITSDNGKPPIYTCDKGIWAGTTPITYTYQWKGDGIDISGETSDTFIDGSSLHSGEAITCCVTATNSKGGVTKCSNSI